MDSITQLAPPWGWGKQLLFQGQFSGEEGGRLWGESCSQPQQLRDGCTGRVEGICMEHHEHPLLSLKKRLLFITPSVNINRCDKMIKGTLTGNSSGNWCHVKIIYKFVFFLNPPHSLAPYINCPAHKSLFPHWLHGNGYVCEFIHTIASWERSVFSECVLENYHFQSRNTFEIY